MQSTIAVDHRRDAAVVLSAARRNGKFQRKIECLVAGCRAMLPADDWKARFLHMQEHVCELESKLERLKLQRPVVLF